MKANREALALSRLIQQKPLNVGREEWERLNYLRTKILITNLKNKNHATNQRLPSNER